MLSDKLKSQIRKIHKSIGQSLDGYQPRKGQNYLVAEIAKTLAGEYSKEKRLAVIEAGTGTGKSLAYCLGAIPFAVATSKKVIISTATVALQEQLFLKDLPFFSRHSGLNFSYELVKGRQRYVCRQKLYDLVYAEQEQLSFTQLSQKPVTEKARSLYKELFESLEDGKWDGEYDSWPDSLASIDWTLIQSDRHSCTRALESHRSCPFHKARNAIHKADVLVVNHALLMADLSLGGGKILPETDDAIYIIDEAHHLPGITRDFSSAYSSTKGALDWLDKLPKTLHKYSALIDRNKTTTMVMKAQDALEDITTNLKEVHQWIESNHQTLFLSNDTYRFEHGKLPTFWYQKSDVLSSKFQAVESQLNRLNDVLTEEINDGSVNKVNAEPLLAETSFYLQRLENSTKLWTLLNKPASEKQPPNAIWLEINKPEKGNRIDYTISAAPLEVGFWLSDMLWSKCAGAVLCSATLTALNKFDYFRFQAGLMNNDGTQYIRTPGPFNYQEQAELVIPSIKVEPGSDQFTDELVKQIPRLLENQSASLVLFSSYWQMDAVADALRQKSQAKLLIQGETSRQALLSKHKKAIDSGKPSILFGTQSLSEGLDLPGKYLTNLIITKIPFAVPDSPVEEAHAEYIKDKGGNPFLTLSVPEASRKLIQACGRLIRKESDTGRVVILDRRLVSRQYGKSLINALPDFRRKIEY